MHRRGKRAREHFTDEEEHHRSGCLEMGRGDDEARNFISVFNIALRLPRAPYCVVSVAHRRCRLNLSGRWHSVSLLGVFIIRYRSIWITHTHRPHNTHANVKDLFHLALTLRLASEEMLFLEKGKISPDTAAKERAATAGERREALFAESLEKATHCVFVYMLMLFLCRWESRNAVQRTSVGIW